MDISPQTISVFVTLFLILAAMGVALIVDLLKGNNEQLRELAIELKAKKDAAEKHLQILEVHNTNLLQHPALAASPAVESGANLLSAPAAAVSGAARAQAERVAASEPVRSAPAAAAAAASSVASSSVAEPMRGGRAQSNVKREMSPAVAAVAESVAARMAAGKMGPVAAPAAAASVQPPVEEPVLAANGAVIPEVLAPAVAAAAAASTTNPTLRQVEVPTGLFAKPGALEARGDAKKDWSRILNTKKQGGELELPVTVQPATAAGAELATATAADNLIQFVPATGAPAAAHDPQSLPVGYHDYSVLRRFIETGRSVQGMVISIGMNQLPGDQMAEVANFVQSMLESEDFACQSGSDEFLMICIADPQSAQRRLSAIAERLWDFQLSSIGHINVQFAWGGMEARPQDKLNDVVASAMDQMTETRRARRVVPAAGSAAASQVAKAV